MIRRGALPLLIRYRRAFYATRRCAHAIAASKSHISAARLCGAGDEASAEAPAPRARVFHATPRTQQQVLQNAAFLCKRAELFYSREARDVVRRVRWRCRRAAGRRDAAPQQSASGEKMAPCTVMGEGSTLCATAARQAMPARAAFAL